MFEQGYSVEFPLPTRKHGFFVESQPTIATLSHITKEQALYVRDALRAGGIDAKVTTIEKVVVE